MATISNEKIDEIIKELNEIANLDDTFLISRRLTEVIFELDIIKGKPKKCWFKEMLSCKK